MTDAVTRNSNRHKSGHNSSFTVTCSTKYLLEGWWWKRPEWGTLRVWYSVRFFTKPNLCPLTITQAKPNHWHWLVVDRLSDPAIFTGYGILISSFKNLQKIASICGSSFYSLKHPSFGTVSEISCFQGNFVSLDSAFIWKKGVSHCAPPWNLCCLYPIRWLPSEGCSQPTCTELQILWARLSSSGMRLLSIVLKGVPLNKRFRIFAL